MKWPSQRYKSLVCVLALPLEILFSYVGAAEFSSGAMLLHVRSAGIGSRDRLKFDLPIDESP